MLRSDHAPIARLIAAVCFLAALALDGPAPAAERPTPAGPDAADLETALTFTDLMRMRAIEEPTIAADGAWIAYALVPDRGDGELVVRHTVDGTEHRAARGRAPEIAADGAWVAARLEPPLAAREHAAEKGEKEDDGPKPGLVLLATTDGARETFDRVDRFAFSADGRFLARQHAEPEDAGEAREKEEVAGEGEAARPAEPATEGAPAETTETADDEGDDKGDDEEVGTRLVVRRLADGNEVALEHVDGWAFDDVGRFLAFVVRAPGGRGNGVHVLDLGTLGDEAAGDEPIAVVAADGHRYHALAWTIEPASDLAFVAETPADGKTSDKADDGPADDGAADDGAAEPEPPATALWLWQGASRAGAAVTASADAPEGRYLPAENELTFSRDGRRLFFGYRSRDAWLPPDPDDEGGDTEDADDETFDPYDLDAILEGTTLDVWHTDDPLIMPHQRQRFDDERKRLDLAVYHRPASRPSGARGRVVPLASAEVPDVVPDDNPRAVLATSDLPYRKERTWDGAFRDLYWVSLADGVRRRVASRLAEPASLSPDGRFVVFYREPHWYLWDSADGSERSLTADLEVPFANEDHDYPRSAPGYGVADWLEDAASVLIYDKYDIWSFPTASGEPHRITGDGRAEQMTYRLIDLDPDRDSVRADESLLLTGYHQRQKHRGLYRATPAGASAAKLLEGEGETVSVLAKAEHAERLLLTRESYRRFPDLWSADLELSDPIRLSDANPETGAFAWGNARLIEWLDLDGQRLEGVVITPDARPDQPLPVLVYFYRFFSQRLHRFNEPAVNHRPSFPLYASDGYAIFLPDIRFELGRPGLSAVKALVPGVQKLIDLGIADPDAIGLHGHSWSGYQTAFVVTQTNIFKAAVAGAPVSNMTSAYSGIRLGSGLARQFQYEKGQSRLGGSLWQARDRYIDNSPVFFADRVETPLLIMFGDRDDAVPWSQGIELYLALRRLGKDAVFLQYRGEPHHLKIYANKLDYATKMKAFFDHHLKGEPAPAWLTEGVPFRGD